MAAILTFALFVGNPLITEKKIVVYYFPFFSYHFSLRARLTFSNRNRGVHNEM